MNNDIHVIATFDSRTKADLATDKLMKCGIRSDQLSLLISKDGKAHHFEVTDGQTKTAEGVGYGAVLGGIAASLTAAAIPGSVFVAGPVAALLASGASGAMAGGLAGGLIGLGIDEDEVKLVEEDFGNGHIVLGVHGIPGHSEDEVKKVLKESKANRIH